MADEKNVSKAPAARVKRVPTGSRGVIPKIHVEDGYIYRVVNDVDDRISILEEAGYELVDRGALRKGRRVDQPAPEGSKAQLSVGQGQKAFVMRQKAEWYKEDQDAKMAEIDKSEQAMKANAQAGRYGKLDITRD
jgi:hypothetical protein